jgi:hypothetical protein
MLLFETFCPFTAASELRPYINFYVNVPWANLRFTFLKFYAFAPPGPGEIFVDMLLIPDLAIDGDAFSD